MGIPALTQPKRVIIPAGSGYDSTNPNGHSDITITGSGFGTKIGYSDHIATSGIYDLSIDSNFGIVGRWDGRSYTGVGNRFKIVDEGINGKCLYAFQDVFGAPGRHPNNTIAFNCDEPVALSRKWFSSVWVKHSTSATTGGQWKYGRWQRSTNSVEDKANESYFNASSATPDNKFQTRDHRGVGGSGDFTTSGSGNVERMPHNKNAWVRMDVLFTLPSAYDAPTEFNIEGWIYDPAGIQSPQYIHFTDNQASELVNPYSQAATEWTQHLYQNYFGNGDFGSSQHHLWLDKLFESVGDDRRVEYCDTAIYANRKRCFVQPVPDDNWTDTSVTIPVNRFDRGDITNGWLHVIVNGASVASRYRP